METTALLEEDLFLVQRRSPGQPDAEAQAPLPLDELSRFPLVIPTRPNALRILVESQLPPPRRGGGGPRLRGAADEGGHHLGQARWFRRPADRRRQPDPPAQQAVHGR